jgi:hypothetical protein
MESGSDDDGSAAATPVAAHAKREQNRKAKAASRARKNMIEAICAYGEHGHVAVATKGGRLRCFRMHKTACIPCAGWQRNCVRDFPC